MPSQPRKPFDQMPLPQQAGILCNDPRFQHFVAIRLGLGGHPVSSTAAAEYIRQYCHIESRAALLTNSAAAAGFRKIVTSFDAWTGKQAAPQHR